MKHYAPGMRPSTFGLPEGFWAGFELLALGIGLYASSRRFGVVPTFGTLWLYRQYNLSRPPIPYGR